MKRWILAIFLILFLAGSAKQGVFAREIPVALNPERRDVDPSNFLHPLVENDSVTESPQLHVVASWNMGLESGAPHASVSAVPVVQNQKPVYQTTQIINNYPNVLQGDTPLKFEGTSRDGVVTILSVVNPTQTRTITLPDASGEITLLGQTIALGDKTSGDYVKSVGGGNGISVSGSGGEGAGVSLGLTDLSGNWNQSGAYDVILNNKNSELKILDSNGTYYATVDVGALSADATVTLSGGSGTILTSTNYGSFISSGVGDLVSTNNLSDLANTTTARTNLGLGSLATQVASNVTISGGIVSGLSSVNGLTIAANGSNTLNIATGKTLAVNNSLTLAGTDGTTLTFPVASDMVIGRTSTDTLTNKTLTAPVINGTVTTTGLTLPTFTAGAINGLTLTNNGTNTLNIATGKTLAISNTLTLAGTDGTTLTLPPATDTLVGRTSTDTLTNKTLTTPVINGTVTTSGLTLPAFTAGGAITGASTLTLDSAASSTLNLGNTNATTLTIGNSSSAIALNGTTTVAAGKTLAITTADSLTVGGTIIPQTLAIPVPLTAAVISQPVFIADANYKVTGAKCIPTVAAALAGTLQVTVDTGTAAAGSGTSQLTGTISLSGTVNTVVSGTVIGSPTTIAAGDRVSTAFGGTLTGLLGHCTIYIKRV